MRRVTGLVERAVRKNKGAPLRLPDVFIGLRDVVGNTNAAVAALDDSTVTVLFSKHECRRGSRRSGNAAGIGVTVANEFQIRIDEGKTDTSHRSARFQ